jgi:tetratricopeptide (TPR) repeat protein
MRNIFLMLFLVWGLHLSWGQGSSFTYDGPLFNQGLAALEAKDYNKSLDYFKKVLAAQPGNPGAYYYAGLCRYRLKDPERALVNFRLATGYPKHGFMAHYYSGKILQGQNKGAEAKGEFQKFLKLSPDSPEKTEITQFLNSTPKDTAKTVEATPPQKEDKQIVVDTLVTSQNTTPSATLSSADRTFKEKNYLKAIEFYTQALSENLHHQDQAWCTFQIANAFGAREQLDQAIIWYQKVESQFPETWWARQAVKRMENQEWFRQKGYKLLSADPEGRKF